MDSEKLKNIQSWLSDKDIQNIRAIDIKNISVDMDLIIIGTATNERLAIAAAEYVIEKCKEYEYEVRGMEGKSLARWILIDLTDIIIHIFLKSERDLYNLEKLWSDGMPVDESGS
ncbi:MAG: ribosome silencing factor [Eubacteriaceae bacterium]|nr:ribosome silencing factor [Eubacteriaceae bacterium]